MSTQTNSPASVIGGSSSDQTAEQLAQQLKDISEKYSELSAKVTQGALVDPVSYVQAQVSAGNLYPKDRYVGLQQTLQKEQEEKKKAMDSLLALQSEHGSVSSKFSTLEKQLEETTKAAKEKEELVATLSRKNKRASLVMEKFPELASFEASGLLPDVPEEKLEETFSAFKEKITTITAANTDKFAAGGGKITPSGKTETQPESIAGAKAHYQAAMQAFSKGDMATYNKEYDQYIALQTTPPSEKQ